MLSKHNTNSNLKLFRASFNRPRSSNTELGTCDCVGRLNLLTSRTKKKENKDLISTQQHLKRDNTLWQASFLRLSLTNDDTVFQIVVIKYVIGFSTISTRFIDLTVIEGYYHKLQGFSNLLYWPVLKATNKKFISFNKLVQLRNFLSSLFFGYYFFSFFILDIIIQRVSHN